MNTRSYADEQREQNPLQYEKSRLVIDVTSDLKIALEEQQLSISDLARRLGRGRAIVARQLSGQENLSIGKLAELAFHLGKRFEVSLVDITGAQAQVPNRQSLALVWSQPRGANLRLNVQDSREHAALYNTAA